MTPIMRQILLGKKKLIVYDSFNRADGALGNADTGQQWITFGNTWSIKSNRAAYTPSTELTAGAYIDAGASDCIISCTVANMVNRWQLSFRQIDGNNFYFVDIGGTPKTYRIYKVQNNTYTNIGTSNKEYANGDLVQVVCNGDSIAVKINGTQILSVTNTFNNTATKHGISSQSSATGEERWENFKVEAI